MPKDDSVVSGEPIEASWGNQIVRDKLVQRATSAADIQSGWPAPQDGETVWQQDNNKLWVFDGTVWRQVVLDPDLYLLLAGGSMTGTLEATAGTNGPLTLTAGDVGMSSDYFVNGSPPFTVWKDPGGFVHLRGRIDNVDPGTIGDTSFCTMPAGYRPGASCSLQVFNLGQGEAIRLYVLTTGVMTFPAGGPGNWIDLTGLSYYAGW